MKPIAQKFGLVSGMIIILYSVIALHFFGDFSKLSPGKFKLFEAFGYLRYLILIITLFFALKVFKKSTQPPVTFRMLMKTGVIVTLIVAAMVGMMEAIYIYVNPDFFEKYGVIYMDQLKSSGASDQEIKQTIEAMNQNKFMQTPWANGLFYFFETAFIGNIVTLAFASLLRTRDAV